MTALWNRAGHYIFVLWFLLSSYLLMAALRTRCGHYIFVLFLFSFFLSFFPRLISADRRLDVYYTSAPGVALVRIYNACLKCAARGSLEMHDSKNCQKFTIAQNLTGYIFAAKARIDSRKKSVKQQCPAHMSSH